MAKLYFKYGVMGSGKTTELLQIAYDYEVADRVAVVMKPITDTKGEDTVVSRMAELSRKVDVMIKNSNCDSLKTAIEKFTAEMGKPSVILVDEAQFLTRQNVVGLRKIVNDFNIPVICFGLRTTFDNKPFEGSTHLFAMADQVEEISTRAICKLCGERLATKNLRLIEGKPVFEGDTVAIDGEVEYMPVCTRDYLNMMVISK